MTRADDTCRILGCELPVHTRRNLLCNKHSHRMRAHGDPMYKSRAASGEPLRWLQEAVRNAGTECILWPFSSVNFGYGQLVFRGKKVHAHRAALLLAQGLQSFPKGAHALHGPCHNRLCVNPRHLRWGDHGENMKDKVRDGTIVKGVRCHNSKLNPTSVRRIRELHESGVSPRDIAGEFGVATQTVNLVIKRKTWRHVS